MDSIAAAERRFCHVCERHMPLAEYVDLCHALQDGPHVEFFGSIARIGRGDAPSMGRYFAEMPVGARAYLVFLASQVGAGGQAE